MSSLVIADIAGIRQRLTERSQEICVTLKRLRSDNAQLATLAHAASDRTEDAQVKVDAGIALQTASLLSTEHARINRALRRMDLGTYGTCSDCGGKISLQRLTYLPFAETCIPCQTESENRQ